MLEFRIYRAKPKPEPLRERPVGQIDAGSSGIASRRALSHEPLAIADLGVLRSPELAGCGCARRSAAETFGHAAGSVCHGPELVGRARRFRLAVARFLALECRSAVRAPHRSFALDHGFRQGEVVLDTVAIATAVLVLDDVAGLGQVSDDAEGGALGDTERSCDVPQAHPRIVSDADQGAGMVGKEAPLRHGTSIDRSFLNQVASFAKRAACGVRSGYVAANTQHVDAPPAE